MLVPKVTLQGENGATMNFVINGKFLRFRANVPRPVSRQLERRLRNMKKPDGTPLFKIMEIMVATTKKDEKKEPIVKSEKVQNVPGNKDAGWKQRKFLK